MDIHRLIKMANEIGFFFEGEPDRVKAVKGVADHIKSFWERRMRREIFEHLHQQQGAGLTDIVREALVTYEKELRPQEMTIDH
jgi:formate dehydrogenase subunit delta